MNKLILCFLFLTFSLRSKPLDVKVTAQSAIVMNADTGAILYEKHPHIPRYPASITKVATALFVLEQKKPNLGQLVIVPAEALKIKPAGQNVDCPAYWGAVDGTKMGLVKGETLSFESLLHGLMMVSGNDAANTIAASLSDSIPHFMGELNEYLRSIGCVNTQFRNPHGLHHDEHFTTAYDMCLITKRALQMPKFREIVSKIVYQKPKTNKHPAEEIRHTNPLLKPGKHYYSKAIGVKTGTGYNSQSVANTIVAAAEHEGRTLIAVLLGCPKGGDRYKDAIRLFEAAFAEEKATRCLLGSEEPFSREITGAKGPLRASLGTPLEISFYPAEEPSCKAALHWDPVRLPIRKGQKVGEVRVHTEEGKLLQKGDLFAAAPVEGTFFFVLKEKFSNIFR
jgi:D-alanyl-D-alanine carboxypeptidase (penicillin-binding protein 5/6)